MLTIQEAANGFSENMKALQGNYFLRGYFKRKAKEEAVLGSDTTSNEALAGEMDERELEEVIKEAQQALDAKRKK